jgi:hypothetical protein
MQISWVEETGTVVSCVVDFENKTVHGLLAFSKGHWEQPEAAHGDKRNQEDLKRWRTLAFVGNNSPGERVFMTEKADIAEIYDGPGGEEERCQPVTDDMPTL